MPLHASPDAARFLTEARQLVDDQLAKHLARARHRARSAGAEPDAIAEAVNDLVARGGKRIRPAITLATYLACGGGARVAVGEDAALDGACAWELLQAYFLIHDDWMDGDATRRGGPTAHVALARRRGGDAHGGAALAILAGDLACALSTRLLLEMDAPPSIVCEATLAFTRVHEQVVLGQAIDLTLSAEARVDVEAMHVLKTGSYTVQGPVELGTIFAGATDLQRQALARYAEPLGIAFQLRDDLLGTYGDVAQTGKPIGADLRTGKRTALLAEALERGCQQEVSRARRAIAAPPLDDGDVAFLMDLFESSGAREGVERRIGELVERACACLDVADLTADGEALLTGLALLASRRDR